jgi:threonine dehydrogenase-like Zn-dependent dehydrogenase
MTRFASLLGAKVVVVGSPTRFARAQKLGAIACVDYRGEKVPAAVKDAFGGHGADVVIEAVGAPQHLPQLTASLANGGKLFLFGVPGDLQFPANLFDGPEQFTVVKKFHDTEPVGHEQTLKFYLNKQIDPADFCDGEMPLEKIGEAFAAIRRREAIKITITMPQ